MNEYPLTGFRFRVQFSGLAAEADQCFQEVGGLEMKVETEALRQGGDCVSSYLLPVRVTYPHLVLKRGLRPDSQLSRWVREALEDFVFKPKLVTISLLNEEHTPLMTWQAAQAWPLAWALTPFNAQSDGVVIETLTLAYSGLRMQK
jgi:phage tail-like protein